MAAFAASFMEYVILKTGSTAITAGEGFGIFTIKAGEHEFSGGTQEQVYDRLLYWLLTKDLSYTPEELLAAAREADLIQAQADEDMLNELAAGGLSEFGQKVEAFRKGRGAILHQVIRHVEEQHGLDKGAQTVGQVIDLVKEVHGQEVEPPEVLLAIVDYRRMKADGKVDPNGGGAPGTAESGEG